MKEALEVGATTLLLDEDTCASNFMHRDARMRVRCPPQWLCDSLLFVVGDWKKYHSLLRCDPSNACCSCPNAGASPKRPDHTIQ
jgi:Predicted ATPase of the ABC class